MKSATRYNLTTPLFLLFIAAALSLAFSNRIIQQIHQKLINFQLQNLQEKVFVQFNQAEYQIGDTIWFKAFITEAGHHTPTPISKIVYLDLIANGKYTAQTRLLKIQNGQAHGEFILYDTSAPGNYQIRAYTNWMRNFDPAFFFSKYFSLAQPGKQFKDRKTRQLKKQALNQAKMADVQFFPEGGQLLLGFPGHIAYKVTNLFQEGIPIKGDVYDNEANKITHFESNHLGMGSFWFTPLAGMKYHAIIQFPSGKSQKAALPAAHKSGYMLQVKDHSPDSLLVEIYQRFRLNPGHSTSRINLLAHVRGTSCLHTQIKLQNGRFSLLMPKALFPTGIVHFTLFNERLRPVSERLVFINHNDYLQLSVSTNKSQYSTRERVQMRFRVTDPTGHPIQTSLALSVLDQNQQAINNSYSPSLPAFLLLTSDLKGNIQSPEWYFNGHVEGRRHELDKLLLTQGWRRFNWADVMEEKLISSQFKAEKGITLSGRITKDFFNRPVKKAHVMLSVLDEYYDILLDTTDDKGHFHFTNLNYSDTINIIINAEKPNGKKNFVIAMDQSDAPDRIFNPLPLDGKNTRAPLEKKRIRGKWRRDKSHLLPHEMAASKQRPSSALHNEADNTVYINPNAYYTHSVLEALHEVPGVSVKGNGADTRAQIRGANSISQSNEPLYLVDDVPVDRTQVNALNPRDVERIEVVKGPQSAIYGGRGSNGVIAVYTRRGFHITRGELNFQILGYYQGMSFYTPKYHGPRPEKSPPDERQTIYWNPLIQTNQTGEAEVEFYTSDAIGNFRAVINAYAPNGKSTYREFQIQTTHERSH